MEPSEPFGASGDDGDESDFGYYGPALREVLTNRLWFRGESLLWWVRGGQTPPLLTTSPGSTPQSQAGVLGQPNTAILFGDEELNTGLHAGGRMTFGLWLDRCEESGLEFSYFILGANTQSYSNTSMGNPILARPFFNVATGAEDSNLIAYPNSLSGTFNATSTENYQGAEALWRRAIVHGCDGRIDILAGYRFQRLTDGLEIADSATSSGTASTAPAGTTFNVSDTFHTRNDFNGADLGFATQWRRNRWSLDTTLKLGIGQTHTQVLINGWTTVIANNTTAGYSGGQLALPSNMGTHDSNQFSVMPEIGFTLGYDLTPRLKATVGYTLLYWSDVARPGDQIDLNLDPAQFPPPTATGTKPAFALHTSDVWAQGLNLGLDYRF
ncbi:MAG: BBP7 family outer membrane beta-barrel protein [Thermoguttaceae bacterium]